MYIYIYVDRCLLHLKTCLAMRMQSLTASMPCWVFSITTLPVSWPKPSRTHPGSDFLRNIKLQCVCVCVCVMETIHYHMVLHFKMDVKLT